MDTIDLSPTPTALIESMRDLGYSIETAIADIVDNSITAQSKNINIRFGWNNQSPWLAVVDDGLGMNKDELISAMRLGSRNPLEDRPVDDLGRFGLGLKTASFSQCRCLTVLSKRNNTIECTRWDLDFIANSKKQQWSLCLLSEDEINNHVNLSHLLGNYLHRSSSGTIVLWENIDRIVDSSQNNNNEAFFTEKISEARSHLELVFHRYLNPAPGEAKISISFNNNALEGYDPFFLRKSTELREEEFHYMDQPIRVQPYILPHHNKVSKSDWNKFAGKQGYLQEQGFYVYRNRRLIISSTWFRMIRKEELSKLIRIKVDIPNTLDHLWKIDVKKSNASPPLGVKNELKRIIKRIEFSGKSVFRQRGQKITDSTTQPLWNRIAKADQIYYELNRDHEIFSQFTQGIPEHQRSVFYNILSSVESTFPRASFFNDSATQPEQMGNHKLTQSEINGLVQLIGKNLKYGDLILMEPFASHKEMTKVASKDLNHEI